MPVVQPPARAMSRRVTRSRPTRAISRAVTSISSALPLLGPALLGSTTHSTLRSGPARWPCALGSCAAVGRHRTIVTTVVMSIQPMAARAGAADREIGRHRP